MADRDRIAFTVDVLFEGGISVTDPKLVPSRRTLLARSDLRRVVRRMMLNAMARSDRPLLGITDLIAAGYGFRLRCSSYVGNLTRP
jgi:hypothetical protein